MPWTDRIGPPDQMRALLSFWPWCVLKMSRAPTVSPYRIRWWSKTDFGPRACPRCPTARPHAGRNRATCLGRALLNCITHPLFRRNAPGGSGDRILSNPTVESAHRHRIAYTGASFRRS